MRKTAFSLAASMTLFACTALADEPQPLLKLDGALTTESDKEPGFYPKYSNEHTIKLIAGRTYKLELVSKDFSVNLSIQHHTKTTSPQAGANPQPGDQGLTRLIYVCHQDGDHALTVKGDGSRKTNGVSDQIGAYSLSVYDISDNEDEIVDSQMNQIFRLDERERQRLVANYHKRFAALGPKLTIEDAMKAEFIARSLEDTPEERLAYESFLAVIANSKSPIAANFVRKLEERNRGRVRFQSLLGETLELHGRTTDGKEWDLKDYRGQVVLLYFYYEGAGAPASVQEDFGAYAGRLVVVGLNLDNTPTSLEKSLKLAANPWSTLTSLDRTDGPAKLFKELALDLGGSMPIILVDPKGKVVANGGSVEASLQLEKLLGPVADKKH